jgi:sterol desaturase/sphingolipid hydroxylase (fatty acid hydroxylase superfamily)
MELACRSRHHRARLFRAALDHGEADWLGSNPRDIGRNDGGTRNAKRNDTAAESKATRATTKAEKLIGHGGMESFTMPEAGVDSLLVYGATAVVAHLLISLGQTLFHRHLGHSRLGGRFFKNHIQFHHAHYAGDHVVSTHYLDNGDNNTLFFLMPVAVVVGLSYFFLRLDLLVVQLAVMLLSFCAHYYIDNQYHVAGSWLDRFSWFRRNQQLHFVHHRHGNRNFAVIDFFWDRLLGTYRSVGTTTQPVVPISP